nr:hypothetical protein [Tanacetum cinerariifolium]
TDRSDFTHEEFADELVHIISPPEYDCFYFRDLPDPGELISILNSKIRENLSTTCVNLPIEDDHSPLLAYVVWIFLAYLTYPVIPPYLHSFRNEDTIFDPGITINRFCSFKPGLSHRCGAFKKFNTYRSHLNEWPMIINGKYVYLDTYQAAIEVPQTLEYRDGQLNVAPAPEVENFTNWKKRFMCHIIDSPDDEEDTRSRHEYLNNLEEEYQARALLAKSKRFFKKGTQSPSQHKPKLRPTKDFEAKYNKVKAKLALLSLSSSASKAKGLIAKAYEWDEEEVSSDDNDMVEVKVMALAEENDAISKEGAINDEWVKFSMRNVHTLLEMEDNDDRNLKDLVFVKSSADDTKVTIPGVERPWLSEAEGFILPNHNTGGILPYESQRNTTDSFVVVIDSSATDYNSADESSVCSIPLPPLKKLDGVEPISRPKTIKSILRSKSKFKAEALNDVTINKPSSAPAKGNKSSSALKVHSAPAGKLKSVEIEDDPPLAIIMKELNNLKLQFSKN